MPRKRTGSPKGRPKTADQESWRTLLQYIESVRGEFRAAGDKPTERKVAAKLVLRYPEVVRLFPSFIRLGTFDPNPIKQSDIDRVHSEIDAANTLDELGAILAREDQRRASEFRKDETIRREVSRAKKAVREQDKPVPSSRKKGV